MAAPVRIPGPDAIQDVAPQLGPSPRADGSEFGASVASATQQLGDRMADVAFRLQAQRQDTTDTVAAATYKLFYEPTAVQVYQDARSKYPDGGPEMVAYLQSGLNKVHADANSVLQQQGMSVSPKGQAALDATNLNFQTHYLTQAVTDGHNAQVATLQTKLNDTNDLTKSQVLAGQATVEDGLKGVDQLKESAKGLYSTPQLIEQEDKWRQGIIDAGIESKTKAGDLIGAKALRDKYYGGVPKWGDSNAAGVAKVATDLGIQPRDLAAVISYETGGKFDPNLMGGKGGNYQGLIQFGPEERAKYGVRPGQSFQEQLPAVENFLRDRGVKPGMSLAQIYSIVNAGSLDRNGQPRWAASDGNGNIASHVQNIQRDHYANADKFLGGNTKLTQVASADGNIAIPGQQPNADASGDTTDGSSGDVSPILPNAAKSIYWDRQFHAAGVDQKQEEARQKAAAQKVSDDQELNIFKDIHSDNPQITSREILNDPKLTKEAKEKLFNLKTSLTGGEKVDKTYGPAFYNLYQRVHAADNDPNRITDPSSLYSHVGPNGDLTVAGVDKLVNEIQGRRTPEGVAEGEMKNQFFKMARGQISGTDEGLHIKDPKGDQLYLKFMAQALPAYDAGKKAGKSATQLLNPDSPDYIGKSIAQFKRPMDQWFADTVGGSPITGGAAPAKTVFDVKSVKSLDDLMAAYRAGTVSREVAMQTAIDKGWAARRVAPVAAVPVSQ